MPTYDYICDDCGHEFEAYESITAEPQTDCPECHHPKLRRKIGPGIRSADPGSCTLAEVNACREPNPSIVPMAPSRPMLTVSTLVPSSNMAMSETIPFCRKYTCSIFSPG